MSTQDAFQQRAAARPASAPLHCRPPTTTADCVAQASSVEATPAAAAGSLSELDVVSYSRDEVEVCREMALVSLVEGCVRSSGVRVVLYKCHMCGGFVSSLGGLTRHMATHGSATPPPPPRADDDVQRRSHQRLKTAATTPISTSSLDHASSCNGHVDSIDITDEVRAGGADVEPALVVVDSSQHQQQQAEDLSKSTASLRRAHRPVPGGRRRASTATESLQCRRPSQRLAYVSSEMLACSDSPQGSCGDLAASEIRAKEHLDDDVTVVIPSDAPLDYVVARGRDTLQRTTDTPRCELDGGKCTTADEIAHAPVKSIMGHPHVHRKARLSASGSSTTTTTTTSGTDSGSTSSAVSSAALTNLSPTAHQQQLSLLSVNAADSSSLQLDGLPAMFGPLALSTFVHGFGGLVAAASPFLSYYAHMPGAAASLLAAVPPNTGGVSSSNTATAAAMDCTKLTAERGEEGQCDDSPTDGAAVSMHVDEVSSNGSGGSSGWTSDQQSSVGLASSPITKCSSLSRTHSRLNVVRRPIKREDACRPVVLADGRTAFRCFYCKKDFCTISDVNRHMDFHEDIRPYKCRFCNYYARTNSQLKVHMMRHQGIREYMCRLCNYKGVTQSDLNRHTKSQIHLMKARNECIQCSEGFVSPMNLEQHRQDKHPTNSNSATLTTDAKVF